MTANTEFKMNNTSFIPSTNINNEDIIINKKTNDNKIKSPVRISKNILSQYSYSSKFIIPHNIFKYCIYNNVDKFDNKFCKIMDTVLKSFTMEHINIFSKTVITIPQSYTFKNNKTPLYFMHIVNDNNSFYDLLKRNLPKTSTYMIFEYSTYSKHKYILVYDNTVKDKNIVCGNITKFIENSLINIFDERVYSINQLKNYMNSYRLQINEKIIFNLIMSFLIYVNYYKFMFNLNNKLDIQTYYNKIVFHSKIYDEHKISTVIEPTVNGKKLFYNITYIKHYLQTPYINNTVLLKYNTHICYLLSKNISQMICYNKYNEK